jgi:diaminohydroxyphosphoribosylaminopyrimidine deaminase/5-amino-6-(5-phosphoribosylamino)uracil reductase
VLADDCRLTDRSGEERSRPLLRIVLDSQLRLPPDSRVATSCNGDVLVVTTSAASAERRKRLEARGVRVEVMEDTDGRASLRATAEFLAREKYLSLMIEAGSKVNWTALESGVADKIFFYYAPKILGGIQSLPVAGGVGRRRRSDAIRFHGVRLHPVTADEFAVEAYLEKDVYRNR